MKYFMKFYILVLASIFGCCCFDIERAPRIFKRDTILPIALRGSCVLPPATPDKSYTGRCVPYDKLCQLEAYNRVTEATIITSRCNEGYSYKDDRVADDKFVSVCVNGTWTPSVLQCKKFCEKLPTADANLDLSCFQYANGPKVNCSDPLPEGSVVIPRCKPHYYPKELVTYRRLKCEKNGWDNDLFQCIPACGTARRSSIDLISHGVPENRGESPWNVAIYYTESAEETLHICGGTLISDSLVVSAAHCFYDHENSKLKDSNLYSVMVGKKTADFKKIDFPTTKLFKISEIHLPDVYTGASSSYTGDIAILKLSEKVTFNEDVVPACLDTNNTDRFNPANNTEGKLSAFGLTENETLPSELLTAKFPFISLLNCRELVSENFKDSISTDKFCSGRKEGASFRPGDGGAGLLFMDPNSRLFYLRGVASNKDVSSYIGTFTDVTQYIKWIENFINDSPKHTL